MQSQRNRSTRSNATPAVHLSCVDAPFTDLKDYLNHVTQVDGVNLKHVVSLDVTGKMFTNPSFKRLPNLTRLDASDNRLGTFDGNSKLESLDLSNNPNGIVNLGSTSNARSMVNLKRLIFNQSSHKPRLGGMFCYDVFELINLEELQLSNQLYASCSCGYLHDRQFNNQIQATTDMDANDDDCSKSSSCNTSDDCNKPKISLVSSMPVCTCSTPIINDTISNLTYLTILNLSRNPKWFINIQSLINIAAVTTLVHLNLSSNDIVQLPEAFGNLINLESLDLTDNKITSIQQLAPCIKLKSLQLNSNPITSIAPLLQFIDLEQLDIMGIEDVADVVARMATLTKLQVLKVSASNVTSATIPFLVTIPSIELAIDTAHIDHVTPQDLAQIANNITSLVIHVTTIAVTNLSSLMIGLPTDSFPNLTRLNYNSNFILGLPHSPILEGIIAKFTSLNWLKITSATSNPNFNNAQTVLNLNSLLKLETLVLKNVLIPVAFDQLRLVKLVLSGVRHLATLDFDVPMKDTLQHLKLKHLHDLTSVLAFPELTQLRSFNIARISNINLNTSRMMQLKTVKINTYLNTTEDHKLTFLGTYNNHNCISLDYRADMCKTIIDYHYCRGFICGRSDFIAINSSFNQTTMLTIHALCNISPHMISQDARDLKLQHRFPSTKTVTVNGKKSHKQHAKVYQRVLSGYLVCFFDLLVTLHLKFNAKLGNDPNTIFDANRVIAIATESLDQYKTDPYLVVNRLIAKYQPLLDA